MRGVIVGWAVLDAGEVMLQCDQASELAARGLLDSAMRSAGGELGVLVFEGDELPSRLLAHAGLRADQEPLSGMFRSAVAPSAALPDGYVVRTVREDEFAERVAVHRAAWLPAALPAPPELLESYPAGASSTFDVERYQRARRLAV